MKPHVSWIREVPMAHRGLHGQAPENSVAAFHRAIDAKYAIELDVQLSKDGQLVVFHDYDLERMTGVDRLLSESTLAELRHLKLHATAEGIPTLAQVLELIAGKVPLLIEVKSKGKVGAIEAALAKALATYGGPFAVQAFNPFSLRWFAVNAPDVLRGQLSGDFRDSPDIGWLKKLALRRLWLNTFSTPHFIAYDVRAGTREFFRSLTRSRDVPLLLWTVDTEEKKALCREVGANMIFEKIVP